MDAKRVQRFEEIFREKIDALESDRAQYEENILDTKRFLKQIAAEDGVGARRRLKYLWTLKNLFEMLPEKPLRFATREDIQTLLIKIKSGDRYKGWTIHDYLKILKKFLRFMDNSDERAGIIKKIPRPSEEINESRVISVPELRMLEEATSDFRCKVILELLYQSACSCDEFCSMRISDAYFSNHDSFSFLMFNIGGMTKNKWRKREIPIRDNYAIGLFKQYIETHPSKNDGEAPLWFNGEGKRLRNANVSLMLSELKRITGFKKPCNPHWFRHSRLTALGKVFTEMELKKFAGWAPDSDMAGRYVHLGTIALKDKLLEKYPVPTQQEINVIQSSIKEAILGDDVISKDMLDQFLDALIEKGKGGELQRLYDLQKRIRRAEELSSPTLGTPAFEKPTPQKEQFDDIEDGETPPLEVISNNPQGGRNLSQSISLRGEAPSTGKPHLKTRKKKKIKPSKVPLVTTAPASARKRRNP